MNNSHKFSCFIIGEGSLPIQCAEILLGREHVIYGMISSDIAIHNWSQERGIPHFDQKNKGIFTFLSQHSFDYLFSIVNMSILPQWLLELPRRCAINYHDAPLPKYAGRYATSWAIMHCERGHGITWHAMTERIDAGDIFKQAFFKIDDDETAFTLNAKCYDAAIKSFANLVDDISYGHVSVRKQDLSMSTFFSPDKRPSPGCILSWNRSARDIDAMVRALDFGSYPNPIGLPKLAIGKDFFIVPEIEVVNSIPTVPPGIITYLDPRFIRVATMDSEIVLRKLLTIDGQSVPIPDFIARYGLCEGYQFKELDHEAATRIAAHHASISQHEAFWAKQLETLENITPPYEHQKITHTQPSPHLHTSMPIPEGLLNLLANRYKIWCIGDLLLAAFSAYLARITGIQSFDIGYRDIGLASDVAELEGIFAACVPLHITMEYKQTFEEVFHTVQEQVKLIKRRKAYTRDVMVRYPALRSKANLQGGYVPPICIEQTHTLYSYKEPHSSELTLVIPEDGAECLWVYNPKALDKESIMAMQQGFTVFLQGIATDTQQHISDLPLLTQTEQYRLLVEWNATQTPYPEHSCIHQLFEAQVERSPGAVAVIFEGRQLTYQELNSKANQLAHRLQKCGVGPEILVGLCVERSLEMMVGLLGILKAGGAYVPLDPTYPSERIAFMLEDARVQVLVTQQHLLTRLSAHSTQTICLDTDAAVLTQQREVNPPSRVASDNLAYVIYTSGSTGRPKGVQIQHRAVVNFLSSMAQQPGMTTQDTLLAVTTLSFDIAALELFLPLTVGAHVIIASRETAASGTALAEILARDHVTIMQATPITWRLLLASGWQGKPDLKILCGGEALPLDLAQQLLPRAASLWNMYGPTETTIWSTLCKVKAEEEVITIGRPIANTQIYLLDPQLQPVPIGVPGELYIAGDGLARGYLNRPDLTDERFITHPFYSSPGARLYKTGDLARYRQDGTIEHLGRLDYQIKLRGFRIEMGEIESVLARHPAVRQAVVVAREDALGDKRLVAYIVLNKVQTATVGDLQSQAAKHLPTYMVPSAFVLLATFPLTPNGKIDRNALPAPQRTRPESQKAFVAPSTSIEKIVAGIWSRLLKIDQIGIHDDFFALGGDSLMAMQVISHFRRVLQVQLSLSRFFGARSIAEQARIIEQMKASNDQQKLSSALSLQDHSSSKSEDCKLTIEHLASTQEQQEDKGSEAVTTAIQASGSRRPFFFLHGDFRRGAYYCLPLAHDLGSDQPFYALEPYRFDDSQIPPALEAMAAAHIQSLRAVQPEGPYLLGGYCGGALVAYEMARQLHKEGQVVNLLVLVNPNPPSYKRGMRRAINRLGHLMRLDESKQLYWFLWLQHIYRYLQHEYRYLRFSHYRRWTTELISQGEILDGRVVLTLGELHVHKLELEAEHLRGDEQIELAHKNNRVRFVLPKLNAIFPEPIFPKMEGLRQDYEFLFFWATSEYVPGLYPGKSTFFFTQDSEKQGLDTAWSKVAATKVEIHHIVGLHNTCKTVHIHDLADHLRMCLNKAQEDRDVSLPYAYHQLH